MNINIRKSVKENFKNNNEQAYVIGKMIERENAAVELL